MNSYSRLTSDFNNEEQVDYGDVLLNPGQKPNVYIEPPEILKMHKNDDGRSTFARLIQLDTGADAGQLLTKSDEHSKSNSFELINLSND